MKIIINTLLIAFFSLTISNAQVKKWTHPRSGKLFKIEQWQVNDLIYKTKKSVDQPFDKKAFALVTSNKGEQKIPLFYNGDNTWIFRFSSNELGEKKFVIQSEIKALNGKKGKFKISANQKKDRHGGIVLNKENPQRFFYEDGSHYFNLAFECDWLYALDYGKEDIKKTEHLLSLLNENKFNQIVMNVYSYDVKWKKDKRLLKYPEYEYGGKETMFPFLGSNSKPDFSSLNITFFKHFDRVISEMHNREIVSHLMIYVWNKLVAWPDMESKADNMYYDYVIKRYQAFPNIIWDVSKEALYYKRATKEYILERIDRTRKLDAFNRLVSVHDHGFCSRNPDAVDFISIQNWQHTLYQNMLKAQKKFPNKPIFNIEHGGYEESPIEVFPGAYTNAEACLRRNYMCLFAGTYTTYYWQGASWNVLIHNPFEQSADFMKPHFDYFKHMGKLFEVVNFENFEPISKYNGSSYALTNAKEGIALIYAPKENHYVGPNSRILKDFDASNATKQWFNTLTGEFTKEEKYTKSKHSFWDWRPYRNKADAVLIVRNLKKKNK